MNELVTCKSLEVGYRGRALLPPIDLELPRGRMMLILGRNGSGKSTLVKTLLGLQPPVAGTIEWAPRVRRAYVPQSAAIDLAVPVRATDVAAWGRLRGWSFLSPLPRRDDRRHRDEALAALGVAELGRRKLRDLSGGQVQRVLFARMLAGETDVAVLDEPTAAMDAAGERAVYATLRRLARDRGIAVVVVTHAVSAALGACDEVMLLDPDTAPGGADARDAAADAHAAGRVVTGTPAEVAEDPTFHALFGIGARPDALEPEAVRAS
jgi:zinc transport system ATP-binding protein